MIRKNPTYNTQSAQLALETAALAVAVIFPAARAPMLVLQALAILSKWASKS